LTQFTLGGLLRAIARSSQRVATARPYVRPARRIASRELVRNRLWQGALDDHRPAHENAPPHRVPLAAPTIAVLKELEAGNSQ
jgi:hypothetical protein